MQEVAILQASATASRPSSCPLYTPSHSCQAVFWISRLLLLLVADADLSTYTSSMNEAYFVDKVVVVVVVVGGVVVAAVVVVVVVIDEDGTTQTPVPLV